MSRTRRIWAGAFIAFCLALTGCRPGQEEPPSETGAPLTDERPLPTATDPPGAFAWPTYHGNAGLTGVAEAQFPDTLSLVWRFKAEAPVWMTPVAAGNRIYFANAKGRIFALDGDGQEIWRRHLLRPARGDRPPRDEVFDAPLLCVDGLVVAGSASGIVYALDAATGDERWKRDLDGTILGSPTFAVMRAGDTNEEATRLFVIEQGSGILHCLDAQTGETVWETEGVDRCDAPPSIGGGVVLFGSCAAALHIFSAETGEMLREVPIDDESQVAGGVAIIGDAAFSGSRSGKVLRVDTKTGAVVWFNEDSQDEVFSTPAVNDAWVVVGSADGQVYGLERATGEQRWAFAADGQFSSPVIAGDKVIACSEGTLHLLRLADGARLWSYEVSDEITSPVIAGALVLVGSDDGTVVAFGPAQQEEGAAL